MFSFEFSNPSNHFSHNALFTPFWQVSQVYTKNNLFGWSMVNKEKEFTSPFNLVYSWMEIRYKLHLLNRYYDSFKEKEEDL